MFAVLAVAAVAILIIAAALAPVLAQGSPFGVPRPAAPPPADAGGIVGWLLARQAQFYRSLSGLIRASKADGSAVWALLGVSFLYGIFHAAGPGHGKAVISSYVVANEETWRRGVVLSFASALLQAGVAVAVVAVAAVALNATAKSMNEAVRWIEIVSYALIAAVGARLTWVKGRALIAAWREGHAAAHEHDHAHAHHHDHGHEHHADHVHDTHCGHAHGPEPQDLAGPGGWRRGLSAIVAVGLRPCSGAILVLVFALAQGLFWAGIASTFVMGLGTAITVAAIATFAVGAKAFAKRITLHRAGSGLILMRGIELGAAVLVLGFGAALLAGYMASERMI